jgi:hypothetical protein
MKVIWLKVIWLKVIWLKVIWLMVILLFLCFWMLFAEVNAESFWFDYKRRFLCIGDSYWFLLLHFDFAYLFRVPSIKIILFGSVLIDANDLLCLFFLCWKQSFINDALYHIFWLLCLNWNFELLFHFFDDILWFVDDLRWLLFGLCFSDTNNFSFILTFAMLYKQYFCFFFL